MKKKAAKHILGLLTILTVLFFVGCTEEPIIEVSENNESTEQSLKMYSELLSTYDIIEDFLSSTDLFMKKDETLLPPEVIVTVIDDDFLDGDGVEVVLDFGELGEEPQGLLCKDKKYRAGKIRITANMPYQLPGAEITLTFPEDNPYNSGSGDQMTKITGSLQVQRVDVNHVKMHCTTLKFYDNEEEVSLVTDLTIRKSKDAGLGIIDDEIMINGNVVLTSGIEKVILTTLLPLKKKYTLDCAQHIVAGKLDIDQSSSKSEISIDFDPLNDQSCDNKVAITINGKTLFYEY